MFNEDWQNSTWLEQNWKVEEKKKKIKIDKSKIKKFSIWLFSLLLVWLVCYWWYQWFRMIMNKLDNQNWWVNNITHINNQWLWDDWKATLENIYQKLLAVESRLATIENQLKDMNRTNFQLKWFKDEIYSNIWILEMKLNWAWRLLDYSQKVYIDQRDKVAWEIVKDEFIDRKTEKFVQQQTVEIEKWKKFNYYEVKDSSEPDEEKQVLVMYLHWHWWNKAQWMNNESFWWNFNRIQNLMIENHWVYITTDVELWSRESLVNHIILIEKLRWQYPKAKIIIAWASNWWVFLWQLIDSSRINRFIDWTIFLWTLLDTQHWSKWYNFMIQNWIPLYIWHWTHDHNPYQEKENFIKIFNEQWWSWKVDIFNNWVHWTPIRMIDWKETINWILKNTR